MHDASETAARFGEDRWANGQEARDDPSNIPMNSLGPPRGSTRQIDNQLGYASSGRNDDGASALTADQVSATTLHEPESLSNSTHAQSYQSASQNHPVGEEDKAAENAAKKVVSHNVARREPYFREWKWEILSVVVSFGLVVGIIVTLAKYDGDEQPVWPYNININSLVSVLTALITAQLGVITSGSKLSNLSTVEPLLSTQVT